MTYFSLSDPDGIDHMHIVIGQIFIFLTGYRFFFYTVDIAKQIYKYIIQRIVGSHIIPFHVSKSFLQIVSYFILVHKS